MINVILYCSYQYSATGYQMAYANMKERVLSSDTEAPGLIPSSVAKYFSYGGATAICGYDDKHKEYFLLLKGIDTPHTDENGRLVYINIAFLSPDINEISDFAKGIFAQFDAVKTEFGNILTLDIKGNLSYGLNFDLMTSIIESCKLYGKEPDAKSAFKINYMPNAPLSFVVVEATWDYFTKMCKLNPNIRAEYISSKGRNFSALLGETRKELFGKEKPAVEKETQIPVEPVKSDKKEEQTVAPPKKTVEHKAVNAPEIKEDDHADNIIASNAKNIQQSEKEIKKPQQNKVEESVISVLPKVQEKLADNTVAEIQNQISEINEWKNKLDKIKKTLSIAVLIALILSVVAIALSVVSITKKGAFGEWQKSYTTSISQSLDIPQTLLL